ncbi:MAG: biopolymer transporter ExbD [Planctomycetes bacterium]|nr:biopolymer transporter ExbD [Planctomycetota bacterium]
MRLFKSQKKADPVIPVVSMSDIAFLLIIFFLVTTNFVKESHIRLKLPKAETGKKEDKIQHSVSVDQDGTIWLNGRKTDNLKGELGALMVNRTDASQRKVFLKCHRDLKRADFMPVIEQMNEAGAVLVLKTDDKSPADLAQEKSSAKKASEAGAPKKESSKPEAAAPGGQEKPEAAAPGGQEKPRGS